MNELHIVHYQKDVENYAFISSLLAKDVSIHLHHVERLADVKNSFAYTIHCILYECDTITKESLKDIQICKDVNIPVFIVAKQVAVDKQLLDVPILYKPEEQRVSALFMNQLLVNIRCIQTYQSSHGYQKPIGNISHGLIAMGASTGGPKALAAILKKMPVWMCGIVIVQHMIDANISSFAKYLNQMCEVQVKVAEENEIIKQGTVYIAKQKQHLVVKKAVDGLHLHYEKGAKVNCVCPSIDVLFQSLAQLHDPNITGVLLTGMGVDGAKGLKEMKEKGLFTIIQNKESCELYGMPKEAKLIQAYHRELALEHIGDYLIYHYANLHQKKERTS